MTSKAWLKRLDQPLFTVSRRVGDVMFLTYTAVVTLLTGYVTIMAAENGLLAVSVGLGLLTAGLAVFGLRLARDIYGQ